MPRTAKALVGLVVAVCFWVVPEMGAATVLYVSPGGDDGAAGTEAAPLRTLVGARDAVRKLKQAGGLPAGGVVVMLQPGRYEVAVPLELGAEDSGTPEAPIVYRAAERGTAILSGGVELGAWQPVADPAVRKLLDPAAASHVLCAPLGEALQESVPGFANGGCGYRGKPEYPIGLYQQGKRLPISRWPNQGYATMGECLGHSEVHGHTGVAYTEGWFRFDDKRLARWVGEPDLWFDGLWFHHWADQKMALEAIDLGEETIRLQNGASHAFGFKKGQEFFAFNAIGEIDRPGEWAVDRASRMVYLWPETEPAANPVTVAVRSGLVVGLDLAHVGLDGLVFEGCLKTAIELGNCQEVMIVGCTLRHTGSWGVVIEGGRGCEVVGCDLHDLGEGGVKASGGDQATLTPGGHLIENNHIHHFGQIVSTYRPGAAIYGVGNTIRHNLIHHAQHQAVFFRGNDHLIEYNVIHDICLHTSDAGALYSCARDWSQRGTVIRQNFIHATGEGVDRVGSHGIYLDDYTSGSTVTGNIVSSVGHAVTTCGNGNMVENNIAINSRKSSYELSSRGIDTFARGNAQKGIESPMITKLIDKRRPYTSAEWQQRYPHLGELLKLIPVDPVGAHESHFCTMRNNVNIGGVPSHVFNEAKVKATGTLEPSLDLYEDPGFVDLAGFDLRLRPDAPLLKKLPDFQMPEFTKMGLYPDARRASPVVKFGLDMTPMPPILSLAEREQAKLSIPLVVREPKGAIVLDGNFRRGEWPRSMLEAKWGANGEELKETSRIRLAADRKCLFVAVRSELAGDRLATGGHVWGKDDGVEIALAVARSAALPNRLATVVLRGYADGQVESVVDGGLTDAAAAEVLAGVRYAADSARKGTWTAELQIPFSSFSFDPEEGNLPVLAHITVRRPVEDTWASWRCRRTRPTWNVKGAYALCLESVGPVAFVPGQELSVARIDVQARRDNTEQSMLPGRGTSAPAWAQKWNRLVGDGGTVYADKWQTFTMEFTPQEDTTVTLNLMGTQTRPPANMVWTYYDDFRVDGAELRNPSFEEAGADGKVVGWNCQLVKGLDTSAKEGMAVELGDEAAEGSRSGCSTHDRRLSQAIRLTKGRMVTITYKAKAVLPTVN